jgi:serine/threonine protein kinase
MTTAVKHVLAVDEWIANASQRSRVTQSRCRDEPTLGEFSMCAAREIARGGHYVIVVEGRMGIGLTQGEVFAERFEVERELGSGGMGTVYLAIDTQTSLKVALKLLWPNRLSSEVMRQRFQREAEIGRSVRHPNIADAIASGLTEDGTPWFAMEYVQGETIEKHVQRDGPLKADDALVLLRQICSGLGAAHDQRIVHCDVSYRNALVRSDRGSGIVGKIIDFGVAKVLGASTTGTTQVLGTRVFMAPEQYRGRELAPSTDVWALGLLAFFVLTGKEYWVTEDSPERGAPPRIAETASSRAARLAPNVKLPPGFDVWFKRCTRESPTERFADANAAGEALSSWHSPQVDPFATTEQRPFLPRWRWLPLLGTVLVVGGVVVVLGDWRVPTGSEPPGPSVPTAWATAALPASSSRTPAPAPAPSVDVVQCPQSCCDHNIPCEAPSRNCVARWKCILCRDGVDARAWRLELRNVRLPAGSSWHGVQVCVSPAQASAYRQNCVFLSGRPGSAARVFDFPAQQGSAGEYIKVLGRENASGKLVRIAEKEVSMLIGAESICNGFSLAGFKQVDGTVLGVSFGLVEAAK